MVSCCGIERDEESNEQLVVTWPSILPPFTGFLELAIGGGMPLIASGLLSVPSGLHFRELWLTCDDEEDISMAAEVVERCCPTLESLKIKHELRTFVSWLFPLQWLTSVRSIAVSKHL